MTCPMMMSLGLYVLGAAEAAERQRVEAHLPGCPDCRAEMRRLGPLPGLLAGVPEEMLIPARPPGQVTGPEPRAVRRRRRRRHRNRTAAAAGLAACLAGAAGAAGGFWLAPGDGGGTAATLTLRGTDQATHVSATADLTATSWGTSIRLQVRGLPLNVPCRLVIRSRAGKTEVAGAWDAWRNGPVSIPASTSWRPSDIASLQVTTATRQLLTISETEKT